MADKHIQLQTIDLADNLYPETKADYVQGLSEFVGDYSLVQQSTPETGYSATYYMTKNNVLVGKKLNLPKHYRLVNADVKKCVIDDDPKIGFKVDDLYIDFIVEDDTSTVTHVYSSKICSGGKGIVIDDNKNINLNTDDKSIVMNANNNGSAGLVPSTASLGTNRNTKLLSGDGTWINGISYEVL